MKKKIVSVIVAIVSVACFIGCSRPADKEEVDIESIKEQVRAELEEENEKAKEEEEENEKAKEEEEEKRQDEERIKEQVKEEVERQNAKNDNKDVNINITEDSKPDPVVIVQEKPQPVYYSSDFIFPQSSTEYLSQSQVSRLSDYQLGIARNEIYARHGYIFKLDRFKSYFESQSWYVPRYSDVSSISLNEIETYNVALIKAEEDSRGIQW